MTEKLLLHACCGPCTIYPTRVLQDKKIIFTAYFTNPNIHPFREFALRLQTLEEFCSKQAIPLIANTTYGLKDFLRAVVFNEDTRCKLCYTLRLEATASYAANHGFSLFSSTLLYSKYQNHAALVEIGNNLADKYGVGFFYQDFREGWQEGITLSKQANMYRQSYCGCIYSEQERYDKSLTKKQKSDTNATNDGSCHPKSQQSC